MLTMFDEFDTQMMRRALDLAMTPRIAPYPNPRVGAVIAKNGTILSEGMHESYGAPHAEYAALEKLGFSAKGATIYVTLEPCCKFPGKRNPSCAELIVKSGIERAVIAYTHPVEGQNCGCEIINTAGIRVERGLLGDEARDVVKGLFHYISTNRPYVTAKWAMTADGLIAPPSRARGDISGAKGFDLLHRIRHYTDAVLVGVGTVVADNPQLNCRRVGFRHPVRVVIDPNLRTPLNSHVANPTDDSPTIIFCKLGCDVHRKQELVAQGVQVVELTAGHDDRLLISDILKDLAARKLYSVLVEGGSAVHGAFLSERAVDEYMILIAPKVLGGSGGLNPVGGEGMGDIAHSIPLDDLSVERMGDDIVLRGRPRYAPQ